MPKLKKELGLLEVFCISSGAMISSGLFILPALAYSKAGPGVILAYLLASVMIIPTVLSKAELTTAMPKTGGIFFFMDRSMGPMMGTLGGLAAWFSLAFKTAFALLGMGIFISLIYPDLSFMQVKLIAIAFCLFFTVINLRGVKLVGKFQVYLVLALLVILIIYILAGLFTVNANHYYPFVPHGYNSILTTAGLVFVSFAGTTKIAAVAGEVKDPGHTLPWGMFLSWGFVSLLYISVIFVTIGALSSKDLAGTLMPISLAGGKIMGIFGFLMMSFAALLAFISTGNAGVLSASRDPMAMGKDELLPSAFGKVSRHGTPWVAIIFTSGFMITVLLFLDLENFVKTASTLMLMLFIFANLSLIFMRESNIRHYRPKYIAPFYPWAQIAGIALYIFLIFEMGTTPLLIVAFFICLSLTWYFIYARKRIKREYALLHVAERVLGIKKTTHKMDEELREILIERDDVIEERFEKKLKSGLVLDLESDVTREEFAQHVAQPLARLLDLETVELYQQFLNRESNPDILVRPGFAIIPFKVEGRNKFEIAIIRMKKGAEFVEGMAPARAAFVVASSKDQKSFYLHAVMWLVMMADGIDFEEHWLKDHNITELRKIVLLSWRKKVIL
jgi:amino acid transporter/mannitol/fructose-specific phosphotransferase system IIA component (Ntr-type)